MSLFIVFTSNTEVLNTSFFQSIPGIYVTTLIWNKGGGGNYLFGTFLDNLLQFMLQLKRKKLTSPYIPHTLIPYVNTAIETGTFKITPT